MAEQTAAHTAALEESVRVAIIENLVSPEYGHAWLIEGIQEELGGITVDVSEEDYEKVEDSVAKQMTALAKPYIEALTNPKNIEAYSRYL